MKWETWINGLLGLWIVASPWVLGFSGAGAVNSVFFGALIVIASVLVLASRYPRRPYAWANAIFGIWMIASPWMFSLESMKAATLSDVVAGGVVMLLAFVRLNALPLVAD